MLFSKNKKHSARVFTATLLPFFVGLLLCVPFLVHAQEANGSFKQWLVIEPLYGLFTVVGWFTSIAITLFGWAVNPDYISGSTGILNKSSVYDMWKLVRDFLNLFFILTLLYTAFTIVFQVAKDYKKTLLSLVLAALFVNFSFPVTRLIIDVTNVPMYYFINQIGTSGAGASGADKLGTVLNVSQLKNILIPDSGLENTEVDTEHLQLSQLITAIIFLFIFSITLLTLALLFVVRIIALVILLIFSSVGFAASSMPGLGEYSKKWWNGLWQYTLFGPAAALMLYIATQFFGQIGNDITASQFRQTGIYASSSQLDQFISAMAMFFVPIIMLWMAIGLASSMSIVGAGAISGRGEKFIKWVGKKSWGGTKWVGLHNPVSNTVRGAGQGAKKGIMGGKLFGFDYGKRSKFLTGNYWATPSSFETGARGLVSGGKKGFKTEFQKVTDKQINEQVAKDKESKLSRTDALARLNSKDEVMRVSAATSLANMDNGIQSMDDLTKVLKALEKSVTDPATGNVTQAYEERQVEAIARADKKIIAATNGAPATATSPAIAPQSGLQNLQTVISSLGNNQKAISDVIAKLDTRAFDGTAADYKSIHDALELVKPGMGLELEKKAKKEGKTDVLVQFKLDEDPTKVRPQVILDILKNLPSEDVMKQDIFKATSINKRYADAYVESLKAGGSNENIPRYQKVRAG